MQTNSTLTTAVATVGGLGALALVGGGVGIVGAFGAVGIGALEIFTGGAILSGIAADRAQRSFHKYDTEPSIVPSRRSPRPSRFVSVDSVGDEIDDLRRGMF